MKAIDEPEMGDLAGAFPAILLPGGAFSSLAMISTVHAAIARANAGANDQDDNDQGRKLPMSPNHFATKPPAAPTSQKPLDAQKDYGRPPRPRPNTPGPAADTPTSNPKTPTPTRPADAQGGKESTRPENANPK